MFGERVDTAPCRDYEAVEELLTPSCSSQPLLADQKQNDQKNPVCDECAAHDEVSQTLASVVSSAETQSCNAPKYKLYPSHYWESLANHTMGLDDDSSNLAIDAFFEMELQVYAHHDLGHQHEHNVGNKFGVNVFRELPALVSMAEEISYDSEKRAGRLHWNVPFRSYHLCRY